MAASAGVAEWAGLRSEESEPFDETAIKDAMTAVRTATISLQATMLDYSPDGH